jgi:hypothetical protein
VKREKVVALASCRLPLAEIAQALGITVPTLKKHYREELRTSVAAMKATLIGNLHRLAAGDGTTAIKATTTLIALIEKGKIDEEAGDEKPAPKAKPLGKKLELERQAKEDHAGTSWGNVIQ